MAKIKRDVRLGLLVVPAAKAKLTQLADMLNDSQNGIAERAINELYERERAKLGRTRRQPTDAEA
jgi:predicted transcriptional regulator